MSFDKGDVLKGFLIGIISSVTAVILWDYYKQKNGTLEYGEEKVISEIKSAIKSLKQDLDIHKSNI